MDGNFLYSFFFLFVIQIYVTKYNGCTTFYFHTQLHLLFFYMNITCSKEYTRKKNEINFTYNSSPREINGWILGSFSQFCKPQSKLDGLHYCFSRNNIDSVQATHRIRRKRRNKNQRIYFALCFLGLHNWETKILCIFRI